MSAEAATAEDLPRFERGAARPSSVRTLDDLARLGFHELEVLYRDGGLPELTGLDGKPRGRMLAIRGPLGWRLPRGVLGMAARSRLFPWRGKSFRSGSVATGEGANRTMLLGEVYPFETRVEPSALDGAPCIRLDYDQPRNPFFIRAIRDELREVAPGLHLGPAMVDGARPTIVLWFAIETRDR